MCDEGEHEKRKEKEKEKDPGRGPRIHPSLQVPSFNDLDYLVTSLPPFVCPSSVEFHHKGRFSSTHGCDITLDDFESWQTGPGSLALLSRL